MSIARKIGDAGARLDILVRAGMGHTVEADSLRMTSGRGRVMVYDFGDPWIRPVDPNKLWDWGNPAPKPKPVCRICHRSPGVLWRASKLICRECNRFRLLLWVMHESKWNRCGRQYGGGGYLPNQDEQLSWPI